MPGSSPRGDLGIPKGRYSMEDISVEFRNVTKKFGEVVAVDGLSLCVRSGRFLTLLGPSGCGKTTTLRMVGGFEIPSSGDIFLMGEEVTYESIAKRETHMVFQNYALFPHKTVAQNIGFGLKMRGLKKSQIEGRVREMLNLINLPDIYDRMPHQLSGGQQQRVALARALILKPPVLLLDEPLGALDAKIRKQLQLELKQLQKDLGITFLYVTHDQEEAMIMSDIIGIMNSGRLEQLGTPEQIYETPKTEFVARFVGECNFFEGSVLGSSDGLIEIQDSRGRILKVERHSFDVSSLAGRRATLAVRPEDIEIGETAALCVNRLEGKIREKLYTGVVVRLVVEIDDKRIIVDLRRGISSLPSDRIQIGWNPDVGSVIPKD
jgi:spermidine/putrescine transport system ATP-binding protein